MTSNVAISAAMIVISTSSEPLAPLASRSSNALAITTSFFSSRSLNTCDVLSESPSSAPTSLIILPLT